MTTEPLIEAIRRADAIARQYETPEEQVTAARICADLVHVDLVAEGDAIPFVRAA